MLWLHWHLLAESGKNPSTCPDPGKHLLQASSHLKKKGLLPLTALITQVRRQLICVDKQSTSTTHLRDHSPAPTTYLRRPPSCVDHSAAIHKKAVLIQPSRKSRPHPTQPKKPSPSDPDEKVVPIRPRWKSRSHSTQVKKPSSFNPDEKAVLIQPIWKSRSHSTQVKKPFPFNPGEKAVPIQPRWKSRPYPTHLKKPFPFNPGEKAVPIQPR